MAFSKAKFESIRNRVVEYMAENAQALADAKKQKRPIRTAPDFLAEVRWLCEALAVILTKRPFAAPAPAAGEDEPEDKAARFQEIAAEVAHLCRRNEKLMERGSFVSLPARFFLDADWLVDEIGRRTQTEPDPDDLIPAA